MTHRVIGLIANASKPGAEILVEKIRVEFVKHDVKLNIEEATAALINRKTNLTTAQIAAESELLLVLGGDGTILHVVNEMGDSMRPVFGINLGSLGFLTCVSSHPSQPIVH
jgi:NAD+ kinase